MADRQRLVAVVLAGPGVRDAAASLGNLAFADEVAVVCHDESAAQAYRGAGAAWVVSPPGGAPGRGPGPADLPGEIVDAARGGWILILGAEERVSLELREEILAGLAAVVDAVRGYTVPVTRYAFGKYLRWGGWFTRERRLYRIPLAAGTRHAASGEVRALRHLLVELGERKISAALQRLNQRTGALPSGAAGGIAPVRLFLATLKRFSARYLLGLGFCDGTPGLVAAAVDAMEFFVGGAKVVERQRQGTSS